MSIISKIGIIAIVISAVCVGIVYLIRLYHYCRDRRQQCRSQINSGIDEDTSAGLERLQDPFL
jgi:hypothetical protein